MTEVYSGAGNANVLISWETVYGTPVAPAKDIGIVTEVNQRSMNEYVASRGLSSRDLDSISMGQWRHVIDLTCEYQHARLIDLALGAVSHGGTADPYTHTITGAVNVNSFTMAVGLNGTADDDVVYDGCKVNSLTIAQDLGGVITMRAEVFAQGVTTDTTAAAAVVDTLPVIPSGYSSINTGDAIAQLRAWEWTVNNNLLYADRMGSFEHEQLLEGIREYSAKVTASYADIKERARFFAGSNSATVPATIDFAGFNATITSDMATPSRSLVGTLTDCHYGEWSRPIPVAGIILQEMSIGHRTAQWIGEDDIPSANWEA
jgi:hypothetical protein